MRSLIDLILAVANLFEAEASQLRQSVYRLAFAIAIAVLGALLLMAGLSLLMLALLLAMHAGGLSWPWASFVTGLIFLVVALFVLGIGKWLSR